MQIFRAFFSLFLCLSGCFPSWNFGGVFEGQAGCRVKLPMPAEDNSPKWTRASARSTLFFSGKMETTPKVIRLQPHLKQTFMHWVRLLQSLGLLACVRGTRPLAALQANTPLHLRSHAALTRFWRIRGAVLALALACGLLGASGLKWCCSVAVCLFRPRPIHKHGLCPPFDFQQAFMWSIAAFRPAMLHMKVC